MKKAVGLVAVSLLGLAAECHAQTNVTFYGIIDETVRYSTNSTGGKSKLEVGDGYFNGSRWGLKGNEDLGNGLQAIFNTEGGFDPSTGAMAQGTTSTNYGQTANSSRLFGRQVFVGLQSKDVGTLTLGRQLSTAYDFSAKFQPYGHPNLDAVSMLSTFSLGRLDNTAKYFGQFGAASFGAHYTLGETAGNTKANAGFGVGAGYAAGPIDIETLYQQQNDVAALEKQTVYGIGGNYAVSAPVKVYFGYLHHHFSLSKVVTNVYTMGANIAASAQFTVSLLTHFGKQKNPGGSRAMFATVGTYDLSKKVSVYAEVDYNRLNGNFVLPSFMGQAGSKVGTSLGIRYRF